MPSTEQRGATAARTPWPLRRQRAQILAEAACEVLDVAADAASRTGLDRRQAGHFVSAVLMSAMDGWDAAGEDPRKEAVRLRQGWAGAS